MNAPNEMDPLKVARVLWKYVADNEEKSLNIRAGAAIMVGSFITEDMEHMICMQIDNTRCCLSVEGTRLIARQLNEWADHAEKKNQERVDELPA